MPNVVGLLLNVRGEKAALFVAENPTRPLERAVLYQLAQNLAAMTNKHYITEPVSVKPER